MDHFLSATSNSVQSMIHQQQQPLGQLNPIAPHFLTSQQLQSPSAFVNKPPKAVNTSNR
jgi:hypothetical protein